jgi:hypothetical protein
LTLLEKKLINSPSFSQTDLLTLNSFDRLSKGMMRFLTLCYTPLIKQEGRIYQEIFVEQETESYQTNSQKRWVLRANLLKLEEEILTQIESEFGEMGGFENRRGVKDSHVTETYWTKEVQVNDHLCISD